MTTTTQHATGLFCWPELATSDPEAAKKFYSRLFGWKTNDSDMGNGQSYTMLQKNGKDVGGLYRMQDDQKKLGLGPNWLAYVAVDNADQAATKIKQNGGKLISEPFDVMDLGRMAVCQDPTTGTFAIWQAKKHAGAGVVNETGAMCWNELITNDAKRALPFYKQVFGWKDEVMPGLNGPYTVLKKDGTQAAGLMQATPEMKLTHPYWMTYFAVDDCDQTATQAQQLGGKIQMKPTDIPDIGRFAVLTDPQNAWFSIIKPQPETRKK